MADGRLAAYRANPVWPVRVAAAATILRELDGGTARGRRLDALGAVRQPVLQLLGGEACRSSAPRRSLSTRGWRTAGSSVIQGARHAAHHTHPDAVRRRRRAFLTARRRTCETDADAGHGLDRLDRRRPHRRRRSRVRSSAATRRAAACPTSSSASSAGSLGGWLAAPDGLRTRSRASSPRSSSPSSARSSCASSSMRSTATFSEPRLRRPTIAPDATTIGHDELDDRRRPDRRPALLARPRRRHRRRDEPSATSTASAAASSTAATGSATSSTHGTYPAVANLLWTGEWDPRAPLATGADPGRGHDRPPRPAADDQADGRAADRRLRLGRDPGPAVAADRRAGPRADRVLAVGAGRVRPAARRARSRSSPTRRSTSSTGFLYQLTGVAAGCRDGPRARRLLHRRRRARLQRLDVHRAGHHLDPLRHRVGGRRRDRDDEGTAPRRRAVRGRRPARAGRLGRSTPRSGSATRSTAASG